MRLLKFRSLCIVLSLSAVLCLSGCGRAQSVPTETAALPTETEPAVTEETVPTETDPRNLVEELTIVVTEEDIGQLEEYPNLKQVDLSGSTCYAAITAYMEAHPEVKVTYSVSFGSYTVGNTENEITLGAGSFEYAALLENLAYLPELVTIHLPQTTLTAEEMILLMETYPSLEFTYTVNLLGTEYSMDTETLDLSFLTPAQAAEAAPALGLLFELDYVELMTSGNQSKLSKSDVKLLVDAAPNANFHYNFYLFGKSISTTDETVVFKNYNIGNDREGEIREALDIMTGCTTFTLDNCKLSNTVLATLRDDYRDKGIKVVWRIYFGEYGKYNALTNTEKIRAVYNVSDENSGDLMYCEDVKYIDMGHNDTMTNLSFVGHMPKLEILIASGCGVTDLSGIENCKNLEFLELAYCSYLKDLTPLRGCESLKYLNISYTGVSDLIPLDGLPLERFVCLSPKVYYTEQEIFMQLHPDCWTRFLGSQPYGIGWRYDDNGVTYSEIYLKIREIFGYDDMPVE